MLVNLLTPLVIATAPTAVTIDADVAYNHETQTRYTQTSGDISGTNFTFGGTQTFDVTGKPWDNDND